MNENQAYGDTIYRQRLNTWYKAGDKVRVGPSYRGNDEYAHDGCEGSYTVVSKMESAGDYKLIKGDRFYGEDEYDLMVNAPRMVRR